MRLTQLTQDADVRFHFQILLLANYVRSLCLYDFIAFVVCRLKIKSGYQPKKEE